MYGPTEVTTGGNALKFYASVRLDVRRIETLKNGTEAYGSRTKVKIVKNKVSPPFREAEFDLIYGKGISRTGEMLDCAVKLGIVSKSGGWFSYGAERLGNGRENVKKMIETDEALATRLENDLRAKLKGDAEAVEEVTKSSRQPKTATEKSANINISADDFDE